MDSTLVQDVVGEVMRRLNAGGTPTRHPAVPAGETPAAERRTGDVHVVAADNRHGIFDSVDRAVDAAAESQEKLVARSLEDRDAIVKLIKNLASDNAESWGKIEFAETKIGRLDHKIEKLRILSLVPGVEFLETRATSGSNGVCLEEFAPFGVIGVVTPVTHSVPTLSANAINMIAGGNALVINAHPSGANCAAVAVRAYNEAIARRFGIDHLIGMVLPPTLETADALFNHRGVQLLVVTGGPQVARAALACRKRAIVAGPGNPPVVVDGTADLANAARSIVAGAAFDNNLLCIGEKQVFVVASVFDNLVDEFKRAGAAMLNATQIDALTRAALPIDPTDGRPHVAKRFVGQDPSVLAQAAGTSVPRETQLLIGETSFDHPFVQVEQMMPFVPLVRVANVDEAIDRAIESEHGYRHTAICHSRDLDVITRFGRRAGTTLFVVNGASPAGLGLGGQGHLSYSIATPTGEGITTPLTFTRHRRVMMTGSLRMI